MITRLNTDGDCPVCVDPAKAASLTSIEEEVDLAWLGLASLAWTAAYVGWCESLIMICIRHSYCVTDALMNLTAIPIYLDPPP